MEPVDNDKYRHDVADRFAGLGLDKSHDLREIVDLTAKLCNKPTVAVALLGSEPYWIKVSRGTDILSLPNDDALFQFIVQHDDIAVISDISKDPGFYKSPLLSSNPPLRFYAASPLILDDGIKIGALCLFDTVPGKLTPLQKKTMGVLSKQVVLLMELQLKNQELTQQIDEIAAKNEVLQKIAYMQSHEIRAPLTTIMGLVNIVMNGDHTIDKDWVNMLLETSNRLDTIIRSIVSESMIDKDMKAMRLNRMVEEIEDYAIIMLDRNGNVENWNMGAQKIKGYSANDIIGKNFARFYTPEDHENNKPVKLIAEAERKGVVRDEGWRVRKDGTKFWARIVITAIHNEKGEVIGFTKVTRDLTDVKESHDMLMVAEERYKKMIDEIEDYAIILLDADGKILNWNSGAQKIKGYKPKEIIGRDFSIFYPDSARKGGFPEKFLNEARKNNRAYHEGWRVRKDGSEFWGGVVLTALHNSEGAVIGFTKVTKDLTEKKLAEDLQKNYIEKLENRGKEIEQLAYLISHDLHDPLKTIDSYLNLFKDKYELTDKKSKEYIDIMIRSMSKIREIITSISN